MMTLQLMNFAFAKLGEIAQFESLSITRSYCGTGSFSLTLDPRAKGAEALAPGVLALVDGLKTFLIEDVQALSRDTLTVKGCMLKGIAKRRVCVPPIGSGTRLYQNFGWDRFTGSAEAAYLHFAENNLMHPEDTARAIPNLVAAANRERGGSLAWQARFDRLDTLFQAIGERTGLGWDMWPDFINRQFLFAAWEGADRTAGDTLCLISELNGNAADVVYRQIRSGSATTAYAGGAGEDEDRFILCEGGNVQGVGRRELWTEAGSIDDASLLALYAQTKLGDAGVKTTISATLIDSGACSYERDYDVGDIVLIAGRFGSAAVRIAEITETCENGMRTLTANFGDAPVTVSALLQRNGNAAR
jgi:hypothetical protein